jgi:hypothetical protein
MTQPKKRVGKILGGALVLSSSLLLFIACGSTSSSGPTDGGASNDVQVKMETGAMVMDTSMPVMDSATCDLSTDLTASIPDAALDEAGTRSTGLCLGCANQTATCKMYIDQCNANCDCKGVVGQVLECIAMGGSQIACGAMAAGISSDAQQIGFALLTCVQNNCADQCTPPSAKDGGGTDGSNTDGSDQ